MSDVTVTDRLPAAGINRKPKTDHHSGHYKRFAFTFCHPGVTSFVPETGSAIPKGGDQGSNML
jgi:hypothetical protein